ncbi:MAG: biopolymer transporter ExbD [Saprospiraceae bacterium]|nr:biopolymer transporter ExbD [Saprospiraceae bacterium]
MGLKKGSKVSAEFNMSSLTDIIFLLLIFFMLTSSLINPRAINLKVPSSSQNKKPTVKKGITLKVPSDEQFILNGSNQTSESLPKAIASAVNGDPRPAEEVTVVLEINENVSAQVLVDVVSSINDAGAKMVMKTKVRDNKLR